MINLKVVLDIYFKVIDIREIYFLPYVIPPKLGIIGS